MCSTKKANKKSSFIKYYRHLWYYLFRSDPTLELRPSKIVVYRRWTFVIEIQKKRFYRRSTTNHFELPLSIVFLSVFNKIIFSFTRDSWEENPKDSCLCTYRKTAGRMRIRLFADYLFANVTDTNNLYFSAERKNNDKK